jgi:cysteine-rich repeat protein
MVIEVGYFCSGQPSVCKFLGNAGDGEILGNEDCDDGNLVSSDGCS